MTNEMFLGLLNMSLTGSLVILAVLVLRFCLRRAPRVISYCLWAVVLFRLLCPVSFSLPVSLLGAIDAPATEQGTVTYIPDTILHSESPEVRLPLPQQLNSAINATLPQGEEQLAADEMETRTGIAMIIWGMGVVLMLLYGGISLGLLFFRLAGIKTATIPEPERSAVGRTRVYTSSKIPTPFVLGVFQPKIFLPEGLTVEETEYILLHEKIHIRRGDHLTRIISWITLCIHWFNPFVWAAFVLSGRDMEMACDEEVLSRLGGGRRKQYSKSLLNLATGRRIFGGVPLAFGEGDTGSRIRNVLRYQKPKVAAVCVAVIAAVTAAVFLLANPAGESGTLSDSSESNLERESGVGTINDETIVTSEDVQGQQPDVEGLAGLQAMNRGEAFTWEVFWELQRTKSKTLELYAGYEGAEWREVEYSVDDTLSYYLTDENTGANYQLCVSYEKDSDRLDQVILMRDMDEAVRLLYRSETSYTRSDEELAAFLDHIPQLSDWILDYTLPGVKLFPEPYRENLGVYPGVAFWFQGSMPQEVSEARNIGSDWTTEEWKADLCILRVEGDHFFFEDGKLVDVFLDYNHAERMTETEIVTGCQEQAIIFLLNGDLYTAAEIFEAEESGHPIPEANYTADIWYVCLAREGAPYGYVVTSRYYSKEDAIAFARSLVFTEAAFTE
ncbi:MAG: hypothetical protein J1E64_11785 [Acetatifactor sp.]|nr:hypothetical protein [Acetatifactor sp.]